MKDWTHYDTPRTWHFWAIWAAIRIVFGVAFYALGWMPAFWFLIGELVPDAGWYLRDERVKLQSRSIVTLCQTIERMKAENETVRHAAETYLARAGRPRISSIVSVPAWRGNTH